MCGLPPVFSCKTNVKEQLLLLMQTLQWMLPQLPVAVLLGQPNLQRRAAPLPLPPPPASSSTAPFPFPLPETSLAVMASLRKLWLVHGRLTNR